MDEAFVDTTPATEEIKTMLPEPDAFRRGYANWQILKAHSKFTAKKADNSLAV